MILGTVQLGLSYGINNKYGKPTFERVKDILDFAYLKGIKLLDSAEAYGNSQNRIGRYHEVSSNKFSVITKFSPTRKNLPKNIIDRVNSNLTTLRVASLYSYMFHSFKDYKKYFSYYKNDLIKLQKSKKINKIGVSLHSNEEITEVLSDNNIDLIQLPFNILDNSNKRRDILKHAKHKGVEVHTRSVFLQGLFFKDIKDLLGDFSSLKGGIIEINKLVTKDRNINALALQYVVNKPYIDNVLIGVDSVEQLKNNISSINKVLPNKIENHIDNINILKTKMLNPANW